MSVFDKFKSWLTGKPPSDSVAPKESSAITASPTADQNLTASDEDSDEDVEDSDEESPAPSSASDPSPRIRWTAKDDARVESEARELYKRGDADGAIKHLAETAILFARHEATSLPCLCVRCLRPELSTAEAEGVALVRDFVVTQYRVLFYWTPAELAGDAGQMRASMRSALRQQLRTRATEEHQPQQAINPFTKEPLTTPPPQDRRTRINPFTGKPVP